jgi:transposase
MHTIAQFTHFVGVDISQAWLDVHVLPSGERHQFANSRQGVWRLISHLSGFDDVLVAMEATGGLERVSAGVLAESIEQTACFYAFRRPRKRLARTFH